MRWCHHHALVNQLSQPPEEMAALIRFTWWFILFTEATEIIIYDIDQNSMQ